jgi:hypothetical protein
MGLSSGIQCQNQFFRSITGDPGKRINVLDLNDIVFDKNNLASTHTDQAGTYRRMNGKTP